MHGSVLVCWKLRLWRIQIVHFQLRRRWLRLRTNPTSPPRASLIDGEPASGTSWSSRSFGDGTVGVVDASCSLSFDPFRPSIFRNRRRKRPCLRSRDKVLTVGEVGGPKMFVSTTLLPSSRDPSEDTVDREPSMSSSSSSTMTCKLMYRWEVKLCKDSADPAIMALLFTNLALQLRTLQRPLHPPGSKETGVTHYSGLKMKYAGTLREPNMPTWSALQSCGACLRNGAPTLQQLDCRTLGTRSWHDFRSLDFGIHKRLAACSFPRWGFRRTFTRPPMGINIHKFIPVKIYQSRL